MIIKKYTIKFLILFLIFTVFVLDVYAQDIGAKSVFYKQRNFGKYYVSDVYAPISYMSLGLGSNSPEYNIDLSRNGKYLFFSETNLGVEIPYYYYESKTRKFSFSSPISFQLFMDNLEMITAPVINTDYRVGFELNYIHYLNKRWVKNIHVKFIPVTHESTHIGDELILYRIANNIQPTRVNISYETVELYIGINDYQNIDENNLSLIIGSRVLLNKNSGWYFASSFDADTSIVNASKRWIEPSFQLEYIKNNGFLTSKKTSFVVSANLSMRVKFSYPYLEDINTRITSNTEEYVPSLNLLSGIKIKTEKINDRSLGFFFRYYYGVNYHGQFRNMKDFNYMGVSVIYY